MNLIDKIKTKKAKTAVIGLGYVGLPLLCEFAQAGFEAVGIEAASDKVDKVNEGISYIGDVPSGELKKLLSLKRIQATRDYSVLRAIDVVSICVPTPLRKSKIPDMSFIINVCSRLAQHLHKEQLIILESTTYPGTTEEIVLPILARRCNLESYSDVCSELAISQAADILSQISTDDKLDSRMHKVGDASEEPEAINSGPLLKAGEDFFLAFSPERVDPANTVFKTKDIPKVIGGITPQCLAAAGAFYQQVFSKVIPVSSTRTAEMVKLLENTFRSVNIALANEMLIMCDSLGLDIWEVIEAAGTKPFGFMPFYPGPGLGGHCIPIDPLYLTWKARLNGFNPKFIELASELNQQMPKYVAAKVQDKLNEIGRSISGSMILVIGAAYKRDVSDIRESPSLEIIKILKEKGAQVSYYDPYVPSFKINSLNMSSINFSQERLKSFDCTVIATDHSNVDYSLIAKSCQLIVDTRNALARYRQRVANSV